MYRVAPVESDVPERSVRRMPAEEQAVAATWPADLPRPVRLLDPPQPVEAMALLPDQPPMAFTWRRVRHRVRRADGPERIAGEWWKRGGEMRSVRDYFRVEDEEGHRLLAVPPRRWRECGHRRSALVSAWVFLRGETRMATLREATVEEIVESLAFALRYEGRKRVNHADETMARITADRLVRHLAEAGFVLMRRPGGAAISDAG